MLTCEWCEGNNVAEVEENVFYCPDCDTQYCTLSYDEESEKNKYKVVIHNYPDYAEVLVKIWNSHCENLVKDKELILFTQPAPKCPKSDKRRIMGLDAKFIAMIDEETELIGMTIENFIYLMVKSGVDLDVIPLEE